MRVRQFIRPDVAVSAAAHLSALALVVLFTEVHPFGSVTAEPIAVDLVTSDQVVNQPDPIPTPTPTPTPQLSLPDLSPETKPAPPAAPPQPAASPPPPQKQQTAPSRQEAAVRPQPQATPQSQPQAARQSQPQTAPQPSPAPSPSLGYTPPEPDVTVKYHVMLGLPADMSVAPLKPTGQPDGDGIEASAAADISSGVVAKFRSHLKTCSKLPATVAPTDHIIIKLTVLMTPEGRLASRPSLGGGTADMKAFDLIKSAIDGLQACQPYTMLPADRYGEWKVLNLTLTPQDFSDAS
jgi:hypothetical protein